MKNNIFIFLFLSVIVSACHNNGEVKRGVSSPDRKKMIEMNRYIITKDRELIVNYCERKGIRGKRDWNGTMVFMKSQGTGPLIKDGEVITFEYDCSLLDGTVCYSSSGSGPKTPVSGTAPLKPVCSRDLN